MMIIECCSQERSFLKFYGLLAEVYINDNLRNEVISISSLCRDSVVLTRLMKSNSWRVFRNR